PLQQIDSYAYAGNRPLILTDPSGCTPKPEVCSAIVEVDAEGMDAALPLQAIAVARGEVGHAQMTVVCDGKYVESLSYGPLHEMGADDTKANKVTGAVPKMGTYDTVESNPDWPMHGRGPNTGEITTR